ncbi:MAG: hypothetical protein QOE64_1377, partial [Frankiales bacterium]|nr:hypothetical protein [Frankiales bacterium]
MSRRTTGFTALVSLLAVGGFVPLLLSGAAAALACPAWSDAKGDAAATLSTQGLGDFAGVPDPRDPSKLTGDPDVDVVSATLSSTATVLTAVVKVDKLGATPPQGLADEHDIYFDLAGKRINAYTIRDTTPAGNSTVLTDSNGGTNRAEYPFTVKYDVATSSVIMTIKTSDLEKVTGKPVAGLPITNLEADTYNPETFSNYDEAPAPKTLS